MFDTNVKTYSFEFIRAKNVGFYVLFSLKN